MLMYPCLQAAKAAAEDAAKTADEVDAATHEVKQEKVRIQHNLTAHRFNPVAHRAFALDSGSEKMQQKRGEL